VHAPEPDPEGSVVVVVVGIDVDVVLDVVVDVDVDVVVSGVVDVVVAGATHVSSSCPNALQSVVDGAAPFVVVVVGTLTFSWRGPLAPGSGGRTAGAPTAATASATSRIAPPSIPMRTRDRVRRSCGMPLPLECGACGSGVRDPSCFPWEPGAASKLVGKLRV
jgi:hypothetical protein